MNEENKKDKKNLRSFHGSHASYIKEEYKDQYGVTRKKEVCYFNRFLDKESLYKKGFEQYRDFGYLCKPGENDLLPQSEETIANLKKLAALMVDDAESSTTDNGNSSIPPGYTYWGQFLDHDITAGTDRSHEFSITEDNFSPINPDQVITDIQNMRTPFFDLDSLYGDNNGPFGEMFRLYDPSDMVKFKIAKNDDSLGIPGSVPNPELGLERDLPRNNDGSINDASSTIALIGDGRNDENTIIAQFHLAMLKFHNCVVDELRKIHPTVNDRQLFDMARKEVISHYQWLIVNDFLKRILDEEVYQQILAEYADSNASSIFDEFGNGKPFMPLEFSTAAYRFGHSMVRNNYDFNQNFGDASLDDNSAGEVLADANFSLLFAFTGKGGERLRGSGQPTINTTLPFNWIIEWERFFDTDQVNQGDKRFARKIDTKIALPLSDMRNNDFELLSDAEKATVDVGEAQFNRIMRHLTERNLLRGYLLSIPTGQAMVKHLCDTCNLKPLDAKELQENNSSELNQVLKDSGFLKNTPLWYYVLKEAEVRGKGNSLGPLGSCIIGRTFIGFLKYYQRKQYGLYGIQASWSPKNGIVEQSSGQPFRGIMDLLRFAKVAVPVSRNREDGIVQENLNLNYADLRYRDV